MFYCREPGQSAPVNLSIERKYFYAHKILLSWLFTKTAMDWKKDLMMYYVISMMDEMSLLGRKKKQIERMKKISTRDWIDVGLARFRSCKSNWISNAFLLITHNNLNMQSTLSLFQTSLHIMCDKSYKYRKCKN